VIARAASLAGVDALLRSRGRFAVGIGRVPVGALALVIGGAGFFYGAVMGGFSLRLLQMLASGLKVPLLLAATTAVCLPSFYVFNAVLGLRDEMSAALRGIFAAQATLAVTLAALAPLTALAYVSSDDYRFALNFNGLPFAIGALCGHVTLSRHYAPLIAANSLHRRARTAWLVLYVFVAIQLAWVLRPFVGDPSLEPALFRRDAWSNAYVEVLEDVAKLARGR
jgi:hypothetical protein